VEREGNSGSGMVTEWSEAPTSSPNQQARRWGGRERDKRGSAVVGHQHAGLASTVLGGAVQTWF
jgi:hypothetical protein